MEVNGRIATGTGATQPDLAKLHLEAQPPGKAVDTASGFFGRWRQWLVRLWPGRRRRGVQSAQARPVEPARVGMPASQLSAQPYRGEPARVGMPAGGPSACTEPEGAPDTDAVLRQLARRAIGYTGADIERLVREARQKARREQRSLTFADLDGLLSASRPTISPAKRRGMAVHEAGHVLGRILLGVGDLTAVTIDTATGGFTEATGEDNTFDTEERCQRYLVVTMAGRAAEQLVYRSTDAGSGGALNSDLAKATQLAVAMEAALGFGRRLPLIYRDPGDWQDLIRHDEALARRAHRRLRQAEASARRLVRRHRAQLNMVADELEARGTIEGPDLVALVARVRTGITAF